MLLPNPVQTLASHHFICIKVGGTLQALTKLESLDISRCNQASTGWASLGGLTRLHSLRLFEVSRLKDSVLKQALQTLTRCPPVTAHPPTSISPHTTFAPYSDPI